jgi:RimJ/RimL family protein N-acetyltransferase
MLQDTPTPILALRQTRPFVLETERLSLRKPTLADTKTIAALANDRRIAEMTRRMPHPYTRDDAVRFVEAVAGDSGETVFLIESNHVPVGMAGVDWSEPDAPELGYWIGVDHWGRGFATEAVRAVIDYTFEAFAVDQLCSGARVVNPASRNVLEKCGFQWSGVELHRFRALGSSTPVDRFRLSRGVWSSLKSWSAVARRER